MSEVLNFFVHVNAQMPEYPRYVWWGAIIVVMCLTQLLKWLVKMFTNKVKDENLRKRINAVIMIIPCLVGIGLSGMLTAWSFEFSIQAGLFWGLASITLYEFGTRVWKRTITEENITNEEIKEDFKEAVKVTKEVAKATKTAESKFDEIVNKIKKGK